MKIVTKVPGKLILLGEYAVLEGSSALVMTVNRFAKVIFTSSGTKTFTLQAPSIGIQNLQFSINAKGKVNFLTRLPQKIARKVNFFLSIFEFGIQLLKRNGKSVVSSEILLETCSFFHHNRTAKLGLGSSAALSVALIASLLAQGSQTPPNLDEIFQMALQAHRAAQGNVGSGIDIAASVYGGVLCYQIDPDSDHFKTEAVSLSVPEQLFMLPIWVGKSSSTSQLVKLFYQFKFQNQKKYLSFIDEMKYVANIGCRAFKEKNISEFLASIEQYNKLMRKLGEKIDAPIVSREHQKMTDIAAEMGIVYKPSGAGGGDIGVCFSESPALFAELKKEIHKAGFEPLDLTYEPHGLQIELKEVKACEDVTYS